MNILKFLKPKACVDFVYDDNTARQALEKMKNHSFTAVPVIDDREVFIGIVTRRDILKYCHDTLNEYEAKYGHKEEKEEIGAV